MNFYTLAILAPFLIPAGFLLANAFTERLEAMF